MQGGKTESGGADMTSPVLVESYLNQVSPDTHFQEKQPKKKKGSKHRKRHDSKIQTDQSKEYPVLKQFVPMDDENHPHTIIIQSFMRETSVGRNYASPAASDGERGPTDAEASELRKPEDNVSLFSQNHVPETYLMCVYPKHFLPGEAEWYRAKETEEYDKGQQTDSDVSQPQKLDDKGAKEEDEKTKVRKKPMNDFSQQTILLDTHDIALQKDFES